MFSGSYLNYYVFIYFRPFALEKVQINVTIHGL